MRFAIVAGLLLIAPAAAAASPTLLGLNGIGPLRLGMSRADAVATGWLTHRGTDCPLGGSPIPITYRLDGPRAPTGLQGSAEFDHSKLTNLSLSRGVKTARGVEVGRSTVAQMLHAYGGGGFNPSSSFVSTFGGTFGDLDLGSERT